MGTTPDEKTKVLFKKLGASSEDFSTNDLIDLYNKGVRWIDTEPLPGVEIVAKGDDLLAAGGNRKAGAGYAAVRSDADEGIRAYHGSPHDFPPAGASAKKAAMPKIGSFDATPKGKMIGYRVVNLDDSGNIVSQADSRVKLSPGGEHNVPMFVSNSPDYVLDYYGHGAWGEAGETRQALLAYEFDPSDILKGNLEDAQPELSIKRGKLLSMKEITDEAAANSLRTLAK